MLLKRALKLPIGLVGCLWQHKKLKDGGVGNSSAENGNSFKLRALDSNLLEKK